MGVYYCCTNITKKEYFHWDGGPTSGTRWSIKHAGPLHWVPFGLFWAMQFRWRGDHVIVADDTSPSYEHLYAPEGYEDVGDEVYGDWLEYVRDLGPEDEYGQHFTKDWMGVFPADGGVGVTQ